MDEVFATLTPANVLAKVAFSEAFNAITHDRQGASTNAAAHRMSVAAEQEYQADVLRFRREMERKFNERATSESLTEPNTDTELEMRHLGMIWKGHYVLAFQPAPSELGWTAGKRSVERGSSADIVLCTSAFAKRYSLNLRTSHARFNFDLQNGAFFIASLTRSSLAEIAVNGEVVGRQMHVLNQHSMKIRVDSLEYEFRYTNFASTKGFLQIRKDYLATTLNASLSMTFDMPTPHKDTRTFGQWTLNNPLGKGSAGRVFLASNSKNQVVAIKVMECTSNSAGAVDKEVARCRDLTALAQKLDDGGRLVRLKEILDPREEASSSSAAFHEVALVLEPMTPVTLDELVGNQAMGGSRGMSMKAATILHDALLGLKFLHENGWLHRDIKPQNIGVTLGSPPRAVILDVGQANVLALGTKFQATPGRGGTLGYLAPEREMSYYDHGADIWPMGVIAIELTYGHNPFEFAINPWRPGAQYEEIRPAFHQRYQKTVDELSNDYKQCVGQKTVNRNRSFIHLGDMVVQMLRHEWAQNPRDRARRINVSEALQHPAWEPLLSDGQQSKRVRLEESGR
ncbi:kinase-like domain-containing protein [Nemania abortiva]|nr:kinase-like domain-containing protein [Nemania abortiva]